MFASRGDHLYAASPLLARNVFVRLNNSRAMPDGAVPVTVWVGVTGTAATVVGVGGTVGEGWSCVMGN